MNQNEGKARTLSAVGKSAVGAGLATASTFALAAGGLDTSGITGALGDASTAIAAIAVAMLAVAGAGIAVRWVLGFVFK